MGLGRFSLGLTCSAVAVWLCGAASCTDDGAFGSTTTSSTTTTTTTSSSDNPACANGERDQGESDVDCGGPCVPCGNGASCVVADDCASRRCASATSAAGGSGGGGAAGVAGAAAGGGGAGGAGAGVCAPCAGASDCASDAYCVSEVCEPRHATGEACSTGDACASGFCPSADGVCCDRACDSACEACIPGKTGLANGTCGPITAGTDPDSECSAQDPSSCGVSGQGCNGDAGAPGCKRYAAGVACADPSCTAGQAVLGSSCDGAGTCVAPAATACAPYQCDAQGQACLSSCTTNADCSDSDFCNANGACVAKKANGDGCSDGAQCGSGFCPAGDGICCDVACGGLCQACLHSKTNAANGTCAPVSGGTDPDSECSALLAPNCNGSGQCG